MIPILYYSVCRAMFNLDLFCPPAFIVCGYLGKLVSYNLIVRNSCIKVINDGKQFWTNIIMWLGENNPIHSTCIDTVGCECFQDYAMT